MLQDKELVPAKEKSIWRKLLPIAKAVVTILILTYIYRTFNNEQKGIADIGAVLSDILVKENSAILVFLLLLVPVNWALESLKWQRLASKAIDITFGEAFRSTLTGLAVGVAVPAQLGDTIGRVGALRSKNRLTAIGAAIISNGIQFYVSVLGGAIGWYYLGESLELPAASQHMLIFLFLVILIGGLSLFQFRHRILRIHPSKAWQKKVYDMVKIIGVYSGRDMLYATILGMARYLVFLSQFVITLSLFNFHLGILTLSACVSLIFLAKTLIPAVNVLGDLGLREFTALFVFHQFNLPSEQVIAGTFLIWILNIVGPILIGIFLIWNYKWKNR